MEGRIYRKEGLTIATLAAELRVPEHALRRAINQRLGYRLLIPGNPGSAPGP